MPQSAAQNAMRQMMQLQMVNQGGIPPQTSCDNSKSGAVPQGQGAFAKQLTIRNLSENVNFGIAQRSDPYPQVQIQRDKQ